MVMELITELSVGRARLLSPVSARANKGQNSRIKYEDQQAEAVARPRPAKQPRAQQVAIPAIQLPALPVNDDYNNDNRPGDRSIDDIYWKTYFQRRRSGDTLHAPELANIIKDSYNLYPREYVFTPKNIYPKLNKKPVRHH
jgi:hypothetical protein